MEARIQQVRSLIDKGRKEANSVHMIFLDRNGEIDMCSEKIEADESAWLLLRAEVRAHSDPHFEIFSIKGSVIFGDSSTTEYFGGVDDDTIEVAVESALGERNRFYREREATYGPSAWPNR